MLTRKQEEVLGFIRQFFHQQGYAPTAAEIAAGIGIRSRGVVHRYLKALVEAKQISLLAKRHRNIQLVVAENTLPLIGRIAAGQPIEAIEQQDSLDLINLFLGQNRYALQVKGDSMIDEGILDGDLVVCEQAQQAENGQIVVALIDSEKATLKQFKSNQDNTVTLIPANKSLEPMTYAAQRVRVQGVYIGLLRLT